MITLKLRRDDARFIEERWLPYMINVAKTRLRDASAAGACIEKDNDYLNCKLIFSEIEEVQKIFKKKLLTTQVKTKFKFTDSQGITLYKFLMAQPINVAEVYYVTMLQQLCDAIHKQCFEVDTHQPLWVEKSEML